MKTRALGALIAIALGVTTLALAAPAQAAPAAPVLSDLDTSTPGHLTGTAVSPGAPRLQFSFEVSPTDTYQAAVAYLDGTTGSFDVPTWGSPGEITVRAVACAVNHCSTWSEPVVVHPTDVLPDVAWSSDHTLAINAYPTVTVDDTAGGGALAARWERTDVEDSYPYHSAVARTGQTTLSVGVGPGRLTIHRCAEAFQHCTPLPITQDYLRIGYPRLTSTKVPVLTQARPLATATLSASLDGVDFPAGTTYELDWSVRKVSGVPVLSGSHSGTLSGAQTVVKNIPLDGRKYPDSTMKITGHLTMHTVDHGDVSTVLSGDTGNPVTFITDAQGPKVTSMTLSRSTIYPLIRTAAYPGSVTVTVKSATNDLGKVAVTYGTKTIASVTYRFSEVNQIVVTWSGKKGAGGVAAPGRYRLYALDWRGNRSTVYREIVVSGKTL